MCCFHLPCSSMNGLTASPWESLGVKCDAKYSIVCWILLAGLKGPWTKFPQERCTGLESVGNLRVPLKCTTIYTLLLNRIKFLIKMVSHLFKSDRYCHQMRKKIFLATTTWVECNLSWCPDYVWILIKQSEGVILGFKKDAVVESKFIYLSTVLKFWGIHSLFFMAFKIVADIFLVIGLIHCFNSNPAMLVYTTT